MQQSMQTQHRMTSAHEAQVMASEVRRATEATNAMSSSKLASVSTEANASTLTTLAPVPAPLAGSRLDREAQVQVVDHRLGLAVQEVRQGRPPAIVQGAHQGAQAGAENLRSHAGSLQRATAKGVTNARSNTVKRLRRPHAEEVPLPRLGSLRTRNQ